MNLVTSLDGLPAGQPAYPNMEHYIFSNNMTFDNLSDSVHIQKLDIEKIKELKENSTTDIYLCGGGAIRRLVTRKLLNRPIKTEIKSYCTWKRNPFIWQYRSFCKSKADR